MYGPATEWVQEFEDKGPFPMTKEEWDALFKSPIDWATISVIQLAELALRDLQRGGPASEG